MPGEKLIWHRTIGSNAVGCSNRADAVNIIAMYSAAVTYSAFEWAGQPLKLPLPLGDLDFI